jgi:hypothetical protein
VSRRDEGLDATIEVDGFGAAIDLIDVEGVAGSLSVIVVEAISSFCNQLLAQQASRMLLRGGRSRREMKQKRQRKDVVKETAKKLIISGRKKNRKNPKHSYKGSRRLLSLSIPTLSS